jgi:hypothetical protein
VPGPGRTRVAPSFQESQEKKKAKEDASDSEDEVSSFRARPLPMVNRLMILPPVDKVQKQAIEPSMAQINPKAPFAERVAQFDNM